MAGCASVSSLTTLHADRSFHETIAYKVARVAMSYAAKNKTHVNPVSDPFEACRLDGVQSESAGGEEVLIPIVYEVAVDGKIVETNGLVDRVSGHVNWTLSVLAASIGAVHLTLVVKP